MIGLVLAGFVLLLILLLLVQTFVRANPASLARAVPWIAVVVLGGALLALLVSGRLNWALAAAGGLLPFVARLYRRHMASRGPAPGGASEVETEWLRMTLDHGSGSIDGTVLRGPFAGRTLGSLAFDDVVALWREAMQDDESSARLIETYLDRARPEWREEAQATDGGAQPPPRGSGRMSRDEALEILGLEPGATAEQVKAAHRRLMAKLHPDAGGSTYLAAKLNEAKDVLTR